MAWIATAQTSPSPIIITQIVTTTTTTTTTTTRPLYRRSEHFPSRPLPTSGFDYTYSGYEQARTDFYFPSDARIEASPYRYRFLNPVPDRGYVKLSKAEEESLYTRIYTRILKLVNLF